MGEIERLNDAFRTAYAEARERKEGDGPVFVLIGDDLVVFRGNARRAHQVRPPSFHTIKAVAHAPIALYAAVHRSDGRGSGAEHRRGLEELRERIASAYAPTVRDLTIASARSDCEELLRRTLACIDLLLSPPRSLGEPSGAEGADRGAAAVLAFARDVGPFLLRLTREATKIHLTELHRSVTEELASMTTEERASLQVVVTGDHQARERSLGMQYFEERLPPARRGLERVLYGEGIDDEKVALALVGLQRLDRLVAKAFFGDEERLQRDVLGDAAAELLGAAELEPIA